MNFKKFLHKTAVCLKLTVFLILAGGFFHCAAASEYVLTPDPDFSGLKTNWRQCSAEVEARLKNLTPDDLKKLDAQLNYIYLKNAEFEFLAGIIAASKNPEGVSLLLKLLADEKRPVFYKKIVVRVLARLISAEGYGGRDEAVKELKIFYGGAECAGSAELTELVLSTLSRDRSAVGKAFFINGFNSQKDPRVKIGLMEELAALGDEGFAELAAGYKKNLENAPDGFEYGLALARAIASFKNKAAYDILSAALAASDRKKTPASEYDQLEGVLASTGAAEFIPAVEELLLSEKHYDVNKGFSYMGHYGARYFSFLYGAYSKIPANDPRKHYFLRRLMEVGYRIPGESSEDAEFLAARDMLIEGLACEREPALKKRAFEKLVDAVKNEKMSKLFEERYAKSHDYLLTMAFYIASGRNDLFEELKKADFLKRAAAEAYTISGEYSGFKADAASAKKAGCLEQYFKFMKVQNSYFKGALIDEAVAGRDIETINKLAAFSKECSPEFISRVKRALVSVPDWLLSAGDERLISFSGIYSSYNYMKVKKSKEVFDSAGGDLGVYLALMQGDYYDDGSYSRARICELVKKDAGAAKKILMEGMVPGRLKLMLLAAVKENFEKVKDIIGAEVFEKMLAGGCEDAEVALEASEILKKYDAGAAYPKIVEALKNEKGEYFRELLMMRALAGYKDAAAAKFLIENYVMPAVPLTGEGEEGDTGVADKNAVELAEAASRLLGGMGDAACAPAEEALASRPAAEKYLRYMTGKKSRVELFRTAFESFAAEKDDKTAAVRLAKVKDNFDAACEDYLIETHRKNYGSGKRLEFLAAALLYSLEIPGPAVKFISEKGPEGIDGISVILKSSAVDAHLLRQSPGYGKQYMAAAGKTENEAADMAARKPRISPAEAVSAICEGRGRFGEITAAMIGFDDAGAAAFRKGLFDFLKKNTDAGKKNFSESEVFADIISSLMEFEDQAGREKLCGMARDLLKAEGLSRPRYEEIVYRSAFALDCSADFTAMKPAVKFETASRIYDSGKFQLSAAGPQAFYYARGFDVLSETADLDMAVIENGLKAAGSGEIYGYGEYMSAFFDVFLKKTADMNARLALICGFLESGNADMKRLVERYFSSYDERELGRKFAEKYIVDMKKPYMDGDIAGVVASNLDAAALKKFIGECEPDEKYQIPWCFFDAYSRLNDPVAPEFIEKMALSKNYTIAQYSVRTIDAMGLAGFKIQRAIFEKLSEDTKEISNSSRFIRNMCVNGGEAAVEFLVGIIRSDENKFLDLKRDALNELGRTRSVKAFEALCETVLDETYARVSFDALSTMRERMILELIEAEKRSEGRLRVYLASVLFNGGVRGPFLALLVNSLPDIISVSANYLPGAGLQDAGRYSSTASRKLFKAAVSSVSAEIRKTDFSKFKDNPEKTRVYAYLVSCLGFSDSSEDAGLLVGLLDTDGYEIPASATAALLNIGGSAKETVLKASSNDGNKAEFQRKLLHVLRRLNARDAAPVFLKALASKDEGLVREACDAIGELKIYRAIPSLIAMLGGAKDYSARDALTRLGDESFQPLLVAISDNARAKSAFAAASSILAYAREDKLALLISEIEKEFETLSNSKERGPKLLLAMLAASRGRDEALKRLLENDENALIIPNDSVFKYWRDRSVFKRIGKASVMPLVNLIVKTDEKDNGQKYDALEALAEIKDAAAAEHLSGYMKSVKDANFKRRLLEYIAGSSRDALTVFIAVLGTEKDRYLRHRAALGVESLAAGQASLSAEVMKLLAVEKDEAVQAVFIRTLGKAGFYEALAKMIEILKNSGSNELLDETAKAIFSLGRLSEAKNGLKTILNEARSEINAAYAARIFGYYQDSGSVDLLCAVLLKSLEKGGSFKKRELIRSLSAILAPLDDIETREFTGTPDFRKALGAATADNDPGIREAARLALAAILKANGASEKYSAPEPPSYFEVKASNEKCSLLWDFKDGKPAGDSMIEIFRDGKNIATVDAMASRYEDSGLKNGRRYDYHIRAVSGFKNAGAQTGTISCSPSKPPGPVEELKIAPGNTFIELSWKYSVEESSRSDLSAFVILRNGREIARLLPGEKKYVDYGLSASKIYSYKLFGVNRQSAEGASSSVSGSPLFSGIKGGR